MIAALELVGLVVVLVLLVITIWNELEIWYASRQAERLFDQEAEQEAVEHARPLGNVVLLSHWRSFRRFGEPEDAGALTTPDPLPRRRPR